MKYVIAILLSIVIVGYIIAIVYYFLGNESQNSLWVGLATAFLFFIFMPVFLAYRYKDYILLPPEKNEQEK